MVADRAPDITSGRQAGLSRGYRRFRSRRLARRPVRRRRVLGDYTIAHAIETGHRAGLEAAAFCGATKPVARLEFPEAAIVAGDDPLSASLRSAPLPHAVGERKGAKFAASASSPPSIGGEVARPELVEGANRSGGRSAFKSSRQSLRRLSDGRDDSRHSARPSRRIRVGRASEAVHDTRHGHRPGQDKQLPCPGRHGIATPDNCPRDRHDDIPPALHACRRRGARRPRGRPSFSTFSPHADARLAFGERRRDAGGRALDATLLLQGFRPRRE